MSEADRPILVIQDADKTDHWPVTRDVLVLGRVDECDIVINERQVSRQHLRIYKDGESYFVEDLRSKNGTWVNGQELKGTRELHDGDEIDVARTVVIHYVGPGSTITLASTVKPIIGGRLELDMNAHRVFIRGAELDPPLSLPQYHLLELLYTNAGGICTRDAVADAVWPDAHTEGVSEQAIDALVRRLRDRLAEEDPETQYILTVRGHGFRLENPAN